MQFPTTVNQTESKKCFLFRLYLNLKEPSVHHALNEPNIAHLSPYRKTCVVIMGSFDLVAARIFRGQQTSGMLGEEASLSWDKFPNTALSKVCKRW